MKNENESELNRVFWDELCGSQLARQLDIKDDSPESLKKFDDWFMAYYPYLEKYVPIDQIRGKTVLEVGLGYGTVGQRMAAGGADYYGLDIAKGPVSMINHRLKQIQAPETGVQGSILEAPFENKTFDLVVAIGCFHHTGDTKKAIDETWRLLKPGGRALIMVYNAYSYRRWIRAFGETWKCLFADLSGKNRDFVVARESARAQYDVNTSGEAAPITDFFSASHIKRMAEKWSNVHVYSENIGDESLLRLIPRKIKNKILGPLVGLDIYCLLEK